MVDTTLFRPDYDPPTNFFDEGPKVNRQPLTGSIINSGSIDTSLFDGYRQGVELTHIKYWDAGMVKIHAGEPGHVRRRTRYGIGKKWRADINEFAEIDAFDPVTYIKDPDVLTYPIVIKDNEDLSMDGIIEPFDIRPEATFMSINVPFEPHTFYGTIEAGNTDPTRASDRILTVDYWSPTKEVPAYIDAVDMFAGQPGTGFFNNEQVTIDPWVDQKLTRGVPIPDTYEDDMVSALDGFLSASWDSHVRFNQKSATAGWTYDSVQGIGTDSIAFGGRTY